MASLYLRGKVWWLKYQLHGRLIRESLRTTDAKIARYQLRKRETELAEGRSPLPPARVDPQQAVEEFLSDTAIRKKPLTLRKDKLCLQDFLKRAKPSSVRQISEPMIRDYLRHLVQERELSPFTANVTLGILQKWLTWCQAHQPPNTMENPAARVRGLPTVKPTPRFLSPVEIEQLLTAAQPTPLYAMIATALFTGLRVSELRYLEWTDLDFERQKLTVQNKHEWAYSTKSRKARTIDLNARLAGILRPRAKVRGLCFPRPGDRLYRQPPRRIFADILTAAKLQGVGWHTLRRTFGSELARQGVSLAKIQKWMGHTNPRTTMDYYIQLSPEFDADINKIGLGTAVGTPRETAAPNGAAVSPASSS